MPGEVESLAGRLSAADVGSRAAPRTVRLDPGEGASGSAARLAGALPGDRRRDVSLLDVASRVASAAAGVAYRPGTRESAAAWSEMLGAASEMLGGDAPRDVVFAAADEAAAALLAPGSGDAEKRARLAETFGPVDGDAFARLAAVARRLADYGGAGAPMAPALSASDSESDGSDAEDGAGGAPRALDLRRVDRRVAAAAESAGRVSAPAGAERTALPGGGERVRVPPAVRGAPPGPCASLDELPAWARAAFPAEQRTLNAMQTAVLPAVFGGDDCAVVCAPTGAGKTTVALLALLRFVGQQRGLLAGGGAPEPGAKAVYLAPMRALVAEVAGTLRARLAALGVSVAEMTGDAPAEIGALRAAGVVVATPEKWDVVTRKAPGETAGAAALGAVRLLVVDEVHLLGDAARGPVLEAAVVRARLSRACRVVALSATLPNAADVARFVGAPRAHVFGAEHRPCPLGLSVVRVAERRATARARALDALAADAVLGALEGGPRRQALVFVHARRETVRVARFLVDHAAAGGRLHVLLGAPGGAAADAADTEACGVGVHHAGLARDARARAERLFAAGGLRVLVCTATLAWGVNLPAHTVVVRGTAVYAGGAWTELAAQDVLQMLGRAGRPQYDVSGEGVVLTAGGRDAMLRLVSVATAQAAVESRLAGRAADVLLAEAVLGRVRTLRDALSFLQCTFFAARAAADPETYGVAMAAGLSAGGGSSGPGAAADPPPHAEKRRRTADVDCFLLEVAHSALAELAAGGMVEYARGASADASHVRPAALGRIAAHYYLSPGAVRAADGSLGPHAGEADVLAAFAAAPDFAALSVRAEERAELSRIAGRAPYPVAEDDASSAAKAALLLQAAISRLPLGGHALAADAALVASSAARVLRALFALCVHRGWAAPARAALVLCRAAAVRQWPAQSPLWQVAAAQDELDAVARLERRELSAGELRGMGAAELGEHVRSPAAGEVLARLAAAFPFADVSAEASPLCRELVAVDVSVSVAGPRVPHALWLVVGAEGPDGADCIAAHRRATVCGSARVAMVAVVPSAAAVLHVWAMSDSLLGADAFASVLLRGRAAAERLVPPAVLASAGADAALEKEADEVSRLESDDRAAAEALAAALRVSSLGDVCGARRAALGRVVAAVFRARGNAAVCGAHADAAAVLAVARAASRGESVLCVTCHGEARRAAIARAFAAHFAGASVGVVCASDVRDVSAAHTLVLEDLQFAGGHPLVELAASLHAGRVVLVQHAPLWGDGRDVASWLRTDAVVSEAGGVPVELVESDEAGGDVVVGRLGAFSWADAFSLDVAGKDVACFLSCEDDAAAVSAALCHLCASAAHVRLSVDAETRALGALLARARAATPVESAIGAHMSETLLFLLATGRASSAAEAVSILADTLLPRRLARNALRYGTRAPVSEALSGLVDAALGELVDAGMAQCVGGAGGAQAAYAAAPRGCVAAAHGVAIGTAEMGALTLEAALGRGTVLGVRAALEMASASAELEDLCVDGGQLSLFPEGDGSSSADAGTDGARPGLQTAASATGAVSSGDAVHEELAALARRVPYRLPSGALNVGRPLASLLLQAALARLPLSLVLRPLQARAVECARRTLLFLADLVLVVAPAGPSTVRAVMALVSALQRLSARALEDDSPLVQLAAGDASELRRRIAALPAGATMYDVDADVLRVLFDEKAERRSAAATLNAFPVLELVSGPTLHTADGAWSVRASLRVDTGAARPWRLVASSDGGVLGALRIGALAPGAPLDVEVQCAAPPAGRPVRLLLVCESLVGADQEHAVAV